MVWLHDLYLPKGFSLSVKGGLTHLHLLVPTLLLPANHGSRMKMHRNVSLLRIPRSRAGLSDSLRPLRNQCTVCFFRELFRVILSRGDVLRHHAGSVHLELEGGEAVQMISRKDTQGTAGDSASAPSVHGCSFPLSHWSVRFATASFPGLLLVERLTLPRWTSRWLTAARQYSWCRL